VEQAYEEKDIDMKSLLQNNPNTQKQLSEGQCKNPKEYLVENLKTQLKLLNGVQRSFLDQQIQRYGIPLPLTTPKNFQAKLKSISKTGSNACTR
jgi:hypothetical protein